LGWICGKTQHIVKSQEKYGWGRSVVERLSQDLKAEFSHKTGFSPQNLWYMRQFYLEYQNKPNLQQLVGEIPWGQNLLILSKVKDDDAYRREPLQIAHSCIKSSVFILNFSSSMHETSIIY
jgi:predicted nuclease of restriction endonuclease-like (RecB) superfamily